MPDNRTVDELSLEELQALVEQRRRIQRAREFEEDANGRRFRPVTVLTPTEENKPRRALALKTLRDRVLFAVEIVAVLALLAVIVGSLFNLEWLNREAVQARAGTPIPTDAAGQELPGSSFPPSSASSELPGSSFPPEPAPAALGVRPNAVAAIPVPTPGPRSPTRIVIGMINVDWPIVQGDSWSELKQGIGHRVGSANPGERGNLILSGHNDVYGEPFRDLEKLEVGQEVLVYAGSNAFRYVVKAKRVVAPSDLTVLAPSSKPMITLITCTPYRVDTMRLVVMGELAP